MSAPAHIHEIRIWIWSSQHRRELTWFTDGDMLPHHDTRSSDWGIGARVHGLAGTSHL